MDLGAAFIDGLVAALAWSSLKYLFAGIAVGFVVGILPGLGGPVTLALMLPVTFGLEPILAFSFLLGMLSVTATTGDITSVLFGVPGETTSAALVLDGYAMSKRGEAGRALGAALMSSLIGALIGAFALAASIPFVRPLVLTFASPEFFMLVVLGLTFMASLGTGSVVRGLISGVVGLMFATVGLDALSGTQRFTFGQLYLWDGVGLVTAAVGLFAIPELFDLYVRGTSIAEQQLDRIEGVAEGVRDTFRHIGLTVRGSLIGTFVGIMPGIGGALAQWMAYAHAARSSKNPEQMGKGAIEGVIGPGAANNSKEGGALIPTIAFGVPGSTTMAILLGAFLIVGLEPGPSMLTTELPLTMSFVWMIVVSNIITVAICLRFANVIAKITFVRASLMIPPIVLLVFIGAFAERNAFPDVLVMLGFGLLGIVMVRYGWPRAPLILGLILGGLAEKYLFRSIERYGGDWLLRPVVIILAVLSVASVVTGLLAERRRRQGPGDGPDPGREADLTAVAALRGGDG